LYIQWRILKIQWKSPKHITNQKEFYENKMTLGRSCIWIKSQEWVWVKGLVTPNYTILNQRVLRYVGSNTGAWFDKANAAWLARKPFNEGALGEVLRLQGREDFIQLFANLPNVIS
jgi:hypothetical protein